MLLTGKKDYNVKTSVIRKYHAKIAQFVNKRGFVPTAQNKIWESYQSLNSALASAESEREALGDEPSAEDLKAIEDTKRDITVYEIDRDLEWSAKNKPAQLGELDEAKLLEDLEV